MTYFNKVNNCEIKGEKPKQKIGAQTDGIWSKQICSEVFQASRETPYNTVTNLWLSSIFDDKKIEVCPKINIIGTKIISAWEKILNIQKLSQEYNGKKFKNRQEKEDRNMQTLTQTETQRQDNRQKQICRHIDRHIEADR